MSRAVFQPSDLPSRMARKIEVDSEFGCRLWTGSCNREGPSGYGTVAYQGKTDSFTVWCSSCWLGRFWKVFR
ncbi:hypothetical protein StrepF001_38970 [Streptomyces sp. F001]|nr:hypothetical protein StrepF001_40115 [Streptomyces sp. F001]RZB14337.1 hypothetical protein StrepF001_38970 [Streptomyces sp. F001]